MPKCRPLQLNIMCGCPICPYHGTALAALPLRALNCTNCNDSEVNTPHDFVSIFRKCEMASTVLVEMAQPLSSGTFPLRICSF